MSEIRSQMTGAKTEKNMTEKGVSGKEPGIRLTGLDGIRAWAILLVVGQHTGLLPESGSASIPLFFLLSGFFTAWSSREEGPEERFLRPKAWLTYYIGRLFRIIPLYYVCIFFFWFFYPGICFAGQDVVLKHMTFFEVGVHFWFLQQEIVMYLFAPLILCGLALIGKLFRDKKNLKEMVYIILLLAAAAWAKLSPVIYLNGNGERMVFRIYIFMMGMAVAYFCRIVLRHKWNFSRSAAKGMTVLGNLIILGAFVFTLASTPVILTHFGVTEWEPNFVFTHDIRYCINGMVWIGAATLCRRGPVAKFFGNGVFRRLSERSYGIYLFHFLLMLGLGNCPEGIRLFLLDLFLSWLIAEFMYALVEKPIGDFGRHLSVRRLGRDYKDLFTKFAR